MHSVESRPVLRALHTRAASRRQRYFLIVALLLLLAFGWLTVWAAGRQAHRVTLADLDLRLAARTELNAQGLSDQIDRHRRSLLFLKQAPEINAWLNAATAVPSAHETSDSVTLSKARERLATLFAAFAAYHPEVTKLRLIGVADQGKEIVRINRAARQPQVVPNDQLQAKGARDFFTATTALADGEVYVSNLDLNQEHGKVVLPPEPTMRLSTPLFGPSGNAFGIIIMNIDAETLLTPLQINLLRQPRNAYLTNAAGDFLLHPDPFRRFGFDLGRRWRWQDEFTIDRSYVSEHLLKRFISKDGIFYVSERQVALDPRHPERYLKILLAVPDSVVVAAERQAEITALLAVIASALLFSLLFWAYRWQRRVVVEQQATLAAIVESSFDAIIGKTLTGRVTSWNQGAERIFGYSADEAIGHSLADLIVPDESLAEEANILARVGKGERLSSFNAVRRRRDGTRIDVSITVSPIYGADGSIIGASKTARDVTEQKAAEQRIHDLNASLEQQVRDRVSELVSARDQLLNAAEVAELGIWHWRLADGGLEWNDRMCAMYEISPEERARGLRFGDWQMRVHPEDVDRTVAKLNAAIRGVGRFAEVFRIVRRDGSLRFIQAVAQIDRNEHGEVRQVSGINRDITEQQQIEQTLRAAKYAADQANLTKSEFVANMSHEIRSPLNAVLGMLLLLQQTPLDARQRDYAVKAEAAGRALLGILNDILDVSKVEAGKLILDPQPLRLDQMLRDLGIIVSTNIGTKPIEIVFDIDPALPDWIVADALRLRQVLLNLTGNAIKFTAQGEVVLSLRLRQAAALLSIAFAVRDTGIGIAPEQCTKIFEAFSQAETSTARRFGGSGLGLAISRHLVALMGGELRVDSTLGLGTTFHFVIDCPPAPPPAAPLMATPALPAFKCLIVDDNATARRALVDIVQAFGWQAHSVEEGESALRLAEQTASAAPFQVVLVDWHMPGLDSWEACVRLRALLPAPNTRIIAMVMAWESETLAQRQASQPQVIDGLLVKPITGSMLFDLLVTLQTVQPARLSLSRPAAASNDPPPLTGLRLLIVEDNPLNRQVAAELLSNAGAQIEVAQDGGTALARMAQAEPSIDLILMDIQMPDMDGYSVTRGIRARLGTHAPPIVAMTANALTTDRQQALDAGMADHIGKPFDLTQLIALILRHARPIDRSSSAIATPPAQPHPLHETAATKDVVTWDRPAALARLGGDQALYQRALQEFKTQLETLLPELQRSIAARQSTEALRILHSLKGIAATVGAQSLALVAAEVEALGKQMPSDSDETLKIDAVLLEARRAVEGLEGS